MVLDPIDLGFGGDFAAEIAVQYGFGLLQYVLGSTGNFSQLKSLPFTFPVLANLTPCSIALGQDFPPKPPRISIAGH